MQPPQGDDHVVKLLGKPYMQLYGWRKYFMKINRGVREYQIRYIIQSRMRGQLHGRLDRVPLVLLNRTRSQGLFLYISQSAAGLCRYLDERLCQRCPSFPRQFFAGLVP